MTPRWQEAKEGSRVRVPEEILLLLWCVDGNHSQDCEKFILNENSRLPVTLDIFDFTFSNFLLINIF